MILCRTSPLTITTLQSPTKGLVLSLEWGWQETLVTKESVTSHWPKLSMDPQSATGSTGLKSILVLTYLPSDGRQVLTCLVQVSVCPELVWGAPGQRSSGFTVAPRTRAMAIVLMCPIQPPKSAVRNRAGCGSRSQLRESEGCLCACPQAQATTPGVAPAAHHTNQAASCREADKGSPGPQGSRLTAAGPWKAPHWTEAAGS